MLKFYLLSKKLSEYDEMCMVREYVLKYVQVGINADELYTSWVFCLDYVCGEKCKNKQTSKITLINKLYKNKKYKDYICYGKI